MAQTVRCQLPRIIDLLNDQDQELCAQTGQVVVQYDGQQAIIQRVYRRGYDEKYYLLQIIWDCVQNQMVKFYPPVQVQPVQVIKTHWQAVE